jgi:hypothetical protein
MFKVFMVIMNTLLVKENKVKTQCSNGNHWLGWNPITCSFCSEHELKTFGSRLDLSIMKELNSLVKQDLA